ncbi:TetR/AcrR family transcriptional regulator [Marinomonas sp. PE14-40]|uniref:TetR/AcrR family transcriptional regulator n=1 Tax=Marinomonas sp. PE14-40 TaxID=3060621 RepID=UPI003F67AACA
MNTKTTKKNLNKAQLDKNKDSKNSQLDWLEFALETLVKKGPDALKIIPLCELKGVTKGSFYHHFKNRNVFIDTLMTHWYQKRTLDFIEQANTQSSPMEKLNKLDQVIASQQSEAEMHIRAWALKEPSIAIHLGKIDQQRQDYLAQCYAELGLPKEEAQDIALMAYANFLGMQQIHPRPSIETVLRVTAMASQAFLPMPKDN